MKKQTDEYDETIGRGQTLHPIEKSYESKTYDELSEKFRGAYSHTCEFVPLMYNRLTLVDGMSHNTALMKIYNDHKDLPGFSPRNVRRNLPPDNPNVPKRVRTSCPKTSTTVSNMASKLSNTKSSCGTEQGTKNNNSRIPIVDENECPSCLDLLAENLELKAALKGNQKFPSAETLLGNERVYSVPKEKGYVITDALSKSKRDCFIIFDDKGKFVCAEADINRMNSDISSSSGA